MKFTKTIWSKEHFFQCCHFVIPDLEETDYFFLKRDHVLIYGSNGHKGKEYTDAFYVAKKSNA